MSDTAEPQIMWEAPDRNWRESAACRGCNPELFHLTGKHNVNTAKAVCATCPVADTCLQWAIENNETMGVWGGCSEKERRIIRRQIRLERGIPFNQPINYLTKPREHGTESGYQWHSRNKQFGPPCDACRNAHNEYTRPRVARWRAGDAA